VTTSSGRVPMTRRGAERLREELKHLKTVERPRIVQAIAEARAHGDLRENAEYHSARERSGFIESRIQDIESKLARAEIIDVTQLPESGRVVFGATVVVANRSDGTTQRYEIVGEDEADAAAGRLSYNSPLGRALIGREEGEQVSVEVPAGRLEIEILEVRYV
jgi:transcription elongation factor GreA